MYSTEYTIKTITVQNVINVLIKTSSFNNVIYIFTPIRFTYIGLSVRFKVDFMQQVGYTAPQTLLLHTYTHNNNIASFFGIIFPRGK